MSFLENWSFLNWRLSNNKCLFGTKKWYEDSSPSNFHANHSVKMLGGLQQWEEDNFLSLQVEMQLAFESK